MPPSRQNANALSALSQLACLGMPGDAVVQDLMRVLRALVVFDAWSYMTLDAENNVVDFHVAGEVAQAVASGYLNHWFGRLENDCYRPEARETMSRRLYDCVLMSAAMPRLHHTAYFHEVLRPGLSDYEARAIVREDGRALGMLSLGRARGRPDFSAHDMALLHTALPHLAHALACKGLQQPDIQTEAQPDAKPADTQEDLHTSESALILVDGRGRICSGGSKAWTLIAHAAGRPQVSGVLNDLALAWAQPWLMALVQRIEALMLGQPARPPVLVERNRYGTFHLRGYVLEAGGGAMAGMYGVQIERRVPLAQRLFASAAITPSNSQSDRIDSNCRNILFSSFKEGPDKTGRGLPYVSPL